MNKYLPDQVAKLECITDSIDYLIKISLSVLKDIDHIDSQELILRNIDFLIILADLE